MIKKIAIQGFEGSFHQQAAWTYFGQQTEMITCSTFREVIKNATDNPACDGAVMAIENSIAGSILPNYNLLQKSNLTITGELYLEIQQNLLVLPGTELSDIKEVYSHPMALLQCIDFLEQHPDWKLVESEDTALSAQRLQESNNKSIAAIASSLAANLFNLNILKKNIHSIKNNYTRFLILEKKAPSNIENAANKASVYFHVKNEKGALANLLTTIAAHDVNLSKLQSFPIPGSHWQYSFHADMEFKNLSVFKSAITALTPLTESLNVYGIYKNGKN